VITINFIWNYSIKSTSSSKNLSELSELGQNKSKEVETAGKIFLTLIAIIPLLGGIWAINHWFSEYNIASDTNTWQAYPGEMISKSITGSSNRPTTQTGAQHISGSYYPEVIYKFTYKDKKYKGTKLDYLNLPAYGDKKKSQEVLDSLPEAGKFVNVYYSPEKHESVLIKGTKNSSYFGILVGVFFLSIGLIAIKFIYRF